MLKMKGVGANPKNWQAYALMLKMCIAITALASPIFNPFVIDPRSSVEFQDEQKRIQSEL